MVKSKETKQSDVLTKKKVKAKKEEVKEVEEEDPSYQKKWRETNKEKIKGYYEKNKDKRKEYQKTYYQSLREKAKLYDSLVAQLEARLKEEEGSDLSDITEEEASDSGSDFETDTKR